MGRFPLKGAAVVFAAAALLVAGCGPKSQVRGAGNVGGLVFAVDPPDAEVVLDGVVRGKASGFTGDRYLEVESGTHRLALRMPGYESYVRDVYVANTLLRIEATLMPEAGAPGGY